MVARFTSLVVVGLLVGPVFGQAPKKDAAAEMLAKLREPANIEAPDVALGDLANELSRKFAIPVVINEVAFKQCGIDAIAEARLIMPRAKGLRLRTVLNNILTQKSATFLVRKDHIEIVPVAIAERELKVSSDAIPEAVVSAIAKERPLNELVADIAEEFDLNVVVAPQAGDSRMAFVSVRLLNVPADKALDVIATAADLRVVRKGNVFFITNRDHANEMFGEKLDRERQKIEVEKLRDAPAVAPPAPPPAPKTDEKKSPV